MHDYIFLMHGDYRRGEGANNWEPYLKQLDESGSFCGGSEIGAGVCVNKQATHVEIAKQLVGYVLIRARDLEHARSLLVGNPVFEAGGTVEVRELPKS